MEGSVEVDGVTGDEGSTEVEGQESTAEKPESKETTTDKETLKTEDSQKAEVTEKGTKLDPDPMSALNQQLANERGYRKQYEDVLNSPEKLADYAKTMGLELTKKEIKEIQEDTSFDASKIETVDDLRAFAKNLDSKIEQKVKELDKGIAGIKESDRIEAVSSQIKDDISAVREKYPALDPKSESYDKGLDEAVDRVFEMADFDPQTKQFLGKARLTDIADQFMKVRQGGEQTGSKNAQTIVKDRRKGAVVTGGKDSAPDESNMTPAQIIASRMARMRRK